MIIAKAPRDVKELPPIYKEGDPRKVREIIRRGEWTSWTKGMAMGYTQANLVILPQEDAFEFLVFCQRNPKPCPVLEVTDVGSPEPKVMAPGADLRTDLPKYRVYEKGKVIDDPTDIVRYWRKDFVAFLLGCSITFEQALLSAGVPVRQLEETMAACAFTTNIQCRPAGKFHGHMVVSMRPMTPEQAVRAVQVTTRFSATHGAPVHMGDPSAIGIKDINKPDFGLPVTIRKGEVPVFWACGITPQIVAQESKVDLMITHYPGHMFITDVRDDQIAIL